MSVLNSYWQVGDKSAWEKCGAAGCRSHPISAKPVSG